MAVIDIYELAQDPKCGVFASNKEDAYTLDGTLFYKRGIHVELSKTVGGRHYFRLVKFSGKSATDVSWLKENGDRHVGNIDREFLVGVDLVSSASARKIVSLREILKKDFATKGAFGVRALKYFDYDGQTMLGWMINYFDLDFGDKLLELHKNWITHLRVGLLTLQVARTGSEDSLSFD